VREEEIGYCRGCGACMGRGEESCPMSDDGAQRLLSEMLWADGVVILTPNYALQVPALLKNLLDRLSFVFHRPRFFGRVFMPIIAQGIYGGRGVHKYLNDTMEFWGFSPVKGAVLQGALYPNEKLSAEAAGKNREKLGAAAGRFVDALNSGKPRKPSFFRLMIFRTTRSSMKHFEDALEPDRAYFKERGWFDSPYYYPVALGPHKRLFGALADACVRRAAKKNAHRILEQTNNLR
jgi:multimeric flavodoxin WrbA